MNGSTARSIRNLARQRSIGKPYVTYVKSGKSIELGDCERKEIKKLKKAYKSG